MRSGCSRVAAVLGGFHCWVVAQFVMSTAGDTSMTLEVEIELELELVVVGTVGTADRADRAGIVVVVDTTAAAAAVAAHKVGIAG